MCSWKDSQKKNSTFTEVVVLMEFYLQLEQKNDSVASFLFAENRKWFQGLLWIQVDATIHEAILSVLKT